MKIGEWFLGIAVNALLKYKSCPEVIQRTLARRKFVRVAAPARDRITVAVVQMKIELLDDGSVFADKYYSLVRQAVESGAQFVVFPEYAWLPILGLLPPVRALAQKEISLQDAVEELAPGGGLTIEGVFRTIAPAVKVIFESTSSELARRFGIYLIPGSAITMDQVGHLFNTAYLYDPDGNLIGTQNKLHPMTIEKDWMTIGHSLNVFKLPFGNVVMPVCMDHTYWETTRIAALHGAEIDFGFSADKTSNESYLAARGVQTRVQESLTYSTGACCITKLFGLDFCGPSYIAAPLGLRPNATSILSKTQTHDQEQVIVADLDLGLLRAYRQAHPHDFNLALYKKYLPQTYMDYRERVTKDNGRKII